jgi:hypothetical protein
MQPFFYTFPIYQLAEIAFRHKSDRGPSKTKAQRESWRPSADTAAVCSGFSTRWFILVWFC